MNHEEHIQANEIWVHCPQCQEFAKGVLEHRGQITLVKQSLEARNQKAKEVRV
jgi:hypothetical protein